MEAFYRIFFLVYLLAFYGFIIYSFLHCCRAKIWRKPLWLLLHLVIAGISVSHIAGRIGFKVHAYLALVGPFSIKIAGSQFYMTIFFPAGALLYWLRRNKLQRKGQPEENAAAIDEENAGISGEITQ